MTIITGRVYVLSLKQIAAVTIMNKSQIVSIPAFLVMAPQTVRIVSNFMDVWMAGVASLKRNLTVFYAKVCGCIRQRDSMAGFTVNPGMFALERVAGQLMVKRLRVKRPDISIRTQMIFMTGSAGAC